MTVLIKRELLCFLPVTPRAYEKHIRPLKYAFAITVLRPEVLDVGSTRVIAEVAPRSRPCHDDQDLKYVPQGFRTSSCRPDPLHWLACIHNGLAFSQIRFAADR